jgi:simple sugar transport system permease protein
MDTAGIRKTVARTALTVTAVLCVLVLILLVAGAPPLEAVKHLFLGSLGSWLKLSHVLTAWIPLTLCACGLLYTFRIDLWNIGVEGQIMAGAVCATAVLRAGAGEGAPVLWLAAAFPAGIVGGGLWAWLAGLLKTRGGVNEIFAGLGLNFVAQAVLLWLIFGPWKRPGIASMSGTEPFDPDLWLPTLSGLRVSPAGLILAVAALVLTGWVLKKTRLGLALKAIGRNRSAAFLHGLEPNRYTLVAMGLAGGLAGLAGTFQVTAVYHRLIPAISSNYGYLALLVVMLSGFRAAPVPAIALFFACLNVGSIQLPMMLQIDSSLSGVIQGVLVLAFLFFYSRRRTGGGRSAGGP